MRIGWVHDFSDARHPGGAQQTNRVVLDNKPDDLHVIEVYPDSFDTKCDIYILNNLRTFTREQVLFLLSKNFINWFHDIVACPHQFTRAEKAHEAICNIYLSELLKNSYRKQFGINGVSFIIPSAIDVSRFENLEGDNSKEELLWLGDVQVHKGIDDVLLEARRTERVVDFWGFGNKQLMMQIEHSKYGNIKGYCPPEDVPRIMSQYRTFIHLPSQVEAFGRSVAEAAMSGCNLIINDNVGMKPLARSKKELVSALKGAPSKFWNLVEEECCARS